MTNSVYRSSWVRSILAANIVLFSASCGCSQGPRHDAHLVIEEGETHTTAECALSAHARAPGDGHGEYSPILPPRYVHWRFLGAKGGGDEYEIDVTIEKENGEKLRKSATVAYYGKAVPVVEIGSIKVRIEPPEPGSEERRIDKAIADCSEAIRLNPKDAYAYLGRGLAYRRKGDPSRAIGDFTEAISLNPKLAEAYCSRGKTRDIEREPDNVIADFTAAIRLNPKYSEAYVSRGVAYKKRGDDAKAKKDFDQAKKLVEAHSP
jgi:tetratricopeptide (TPR) repeat protein